MKRLPILFTLLFALPFFISAQDYKKGQYYLEIEQYNKARAHFQEIIKSNASDANAYFYLGESYLEQGKKDSAKIYFSKGLEVNPKSALNMAGLGMVAYPSNSTEGENYFSQALAASKAKDAEVPELIAAYYLVNKQTDKAQELLDRAIKADPKRSNVYLVQGDLYLQKNDGSKALENYERMALPLNPEKSKTYIAIGKLYTRTRNYDVALENFNKALAKDANYSPAYKEMAELYYKAGQYKKAISSFEKYLSIADKDAESELRYASFIFLNKDYEATLKILNQLAAKESDNYILDRLIGYSYYETGDYDKALANLNSLFKKAKPMQIIASDYEYLGKTYAKKGNSDLALENLKLAAQKDPNNGELWIEIGNSYFTAKKFAEAANAYESKLSKTTGSANEYLNYGKSLFYQEKFKAADSVFTILVNQIPTLPHGYIWKAKACEQMDVDMKQGLALAPYTKLIEVADPAKNKSDLVNAYSYLGSYYSQQNQTEKSAEAWKKVKELDPANKNAAQALKNYTK